MDIDKEISEITKIDNTKLEELMKQDITPEMEREFFETLKESQMFLPVTYSPNMFEGLEMQRWAMCFSRKDRSASASTT